MKVFTRHGWIPLPDPTVCLMALLVGLATPLAAQEPTTEPVEPRTFPTPLPEAIPKESVFHATGDESQPIDWATVLELARGSNLAIEMAREKVFEAHTRLKLAQQQWLPSLNVGVNHYHHEGRIQEIPGQIIDTSKGNLFGGGYLDMTIEPKKILIDVLKAKQGVHSRSGELDRATRDTLQKASLAYLDLVSAQAGAAIAVEVADLIGELVDRSAELLKQGVGTQVDVSLNRAQYQTQLYKLNIARKNQLAASAQLVQLLNLQPGTRLYAADSHLVPIQLIDVSRSEDDLVMQAQSQGPGLAEVASLIEVLENQQNRLRRVNFLPTISLGVGQGTFGGGFGGDFQDFDSRTDTTVGINWDLMSMVGTRQTRNLFQSQKRQAQIAHHQLMQKLAAGVIVGRAEAISAHERIKLSESEIETAIRSYKLSQARLKAAETLSFEVLQAIGALGQARVNYLRAVMQYNQAQIQLQYLLGFEDCRCHDNEILTVDSEITPTEAVDGVESTDGAVVTEPATAIEMQPAAPPVSAAEEIVDPEGIPSPASVAPRPLDNDIDRLIRDPSSQKNPNKSMRKWIRSHRRRVKRDVILPAGP
ncbi:Outer membrane efflux protein [Planctomycetes bacterium Pan216]|uniref:Outer membrane efflux protein n=1 Tax=Kolteria novifilia TaxID=2527975 RepID=A0A518BA88_9BACT|nr:Outer membrane efflux protein [Planctomycetes bacterium Pan216]